MASSVYVYGSVDDYEKYNRNMLGAEKFHNIIIAIYVNKNNGDLIFVSEYKNEVVSPVIIGNSVKHVFLPYNRYGNITEFMLSKFSEFTRIDLDFDQIRWKHTTETNGILEFRFVETIRFLGFKLFKIKKTKAKIFTQKVIYSGRMFSKWSNVIDILYDMARDRISIIL